MSTTVTMKQDPAADWTSRNPVLGQFEIGIESDTGKAKLGDGVTAWNSLSYFNPSGVEASTVKVYRALLTQRGTDAPEATVLENTLGGTVVWTYNNVGIYIATLAGAFTANKTALSCHLYKDFENVTTYPIARFFRADADEVRLHNAEADVSAGTLTYLNALLADTYVEILVYP